MRFHITWYSIHIIS